MVKVSWSTAEDAIITRVLREQKVMGCQAESGWKKQAWVACYEELKKENPQTDKIAGKVEDHYRNLKADFVAVEKLSKRSGFGWDDTLNMVTATDQVWNDYLAEYPSAKKWRTKPFPLFDDFLFLVSGIVATGAGAFHAGRAQLEADTPSTPPSDPLTQTEEGDATEENDQGGQVSDTAAEDLIANLSADNRKRKRRTTSDSPEPKTSHAHTSSMSTGGRHQRNAAAASDVANAIRDLSTSMQATSTPRRRRHAIELMQEDAEFSEEEEVKILQLFTREPAVADAFVAINRKRLCTAYITAMVEEKEY